MATPAQVVQQGIQDGFQRAQARKQELEDEQRKATLKTLQEDADTPQDKVAAIQAVYHKDPGVLKQHVENLTRRITGKQPQPVVDPQQAQQERLAPIVNRGKTPAQQGLDQQQASGDIANKQAQQAAQAKQQQTFALIDQYVKDPEQNKTLKEDYIAKQAGAAVKPTLKEYMSPDGKQRQWFDVNKVPEGWQAVQGGAKPPLPKLTTVNGHRVLIDPSTGKITHDLGAASEVRTTTRETPITDADGHVHIEKLTSVSVPGMGNVDVDPGEAGSPKGPAPKRSSSGAPKAGGDRTLPFNKATPASNTAKKAVDTAENSYLDVQKAGAGGNLDPVGSQGVVLSWLRGRVNRVTATEIETVKNLGGIFDKFDGTVSSIERGTMTPKQYQWFLRSAKDNYDNAKQVASKYSAPAPKSESNPDPSKDPLGVL